MNREEFARMTQEYVYLDGATGSNLVKAGMPSGVCPEQWILEHGHVLVDLQREYVKAGTDILMAPTFTANRVKLAEYGLEGRLQEMNRDLVALSRIAADTATGRRVFVAADLSMTGVQLAPIGPMELETLIGIYKEQILAVQKAGVDLLAVETMMSLAEARAALLAAKEVCDLPVMVTMTFEPDGKTLYGTDARTAAIVLESLGAAAIGVNCSTGPGKMRQVIQDMAGVTRKVPIIAKPNAGLPFLDSQGHTCYNCDVDVFVEEMGLLVEAGATILGGCCGTTPDYISGLYRSFGRKIAVEAKRCPPSRYFLTSERQSLSFEPGDGLLVVGERINPTGKKQLQAQLREGSMDMVLQFAEEQEQDGARILDINMGMSGIDEKAMMLQAIEEVSGVTSLPLSLDSSHVDVLEAALRRYPGRALINSISLETVKCEKLLTLAEKYGAMFILLPLWDKGLPGHLEEKKEIIEQVLEHALQHGLHHWDVVVDGLVTTVGANRQAALETLETIRYCRERGLATVCGLSNISFGLPERSYVNTAFLALAIREGLTMAIANPSQELLMAGALATDLLLAKEEADTRYIAYAGKIAGTRSGQETRSQKKDTDQHTGSREQQEKYSGDATDMVSKEISHQPYAVKEPLSDIAEELYKAVLKGNRKGIAGITSTALSQGEDPAGLLHQVLLPAINEVGDLFDSGKYFLPQLIGSAESMKNAIQILEPLLRKEPGAKDMPVVVIATVEGDIHDIGKNLVALMLKNHGFQVIDLGKDVPGEVIVQAALEHKARIIALSALMTTTMQQMRKVVALVREAHLSVKVMIGGAVITQDYAQEIGADGYSRDAADAVKLARRLLEETGGQDTGAV